MYVCRDFGDRVVTSSIWSSDVDITRIKVQVSYVYLFFLIMISIQFHYMVTGSCKPSHMCTNICLKNIKQCLCFLFDRLWLWPVIVLLSFQNPPLLSTYYCFLIIQIIWYTFYHSGGKVFEESVSKQEVFGSMMKEYFLIYFAILTSLLSF